VRQLNFYGFRKIKDDHIKKITSPEANHWRFCHEKFQRGRPELFAEIRHSKQITKTNQEEGVDELKKEAKELRRRLNSMTKEVRKLTDMMYSVPQTPQVEWEMKQESPKRRKIDHSDYCTGHEEQSNIISPTWSEPTLPLPLHDHVCPDDNISHFEFERLFLPEDEVCPDTVPSSAAPKPPQPLGCLSSFDNFIEKDYGLDRFMNDLDTSDDFAIVPSSPRQQQQHPITTTDSSSLDPQLVQGMRDSLTRLPKQMQEIFVERLVAYVADPDRLNDHVRAISALATAAATQTHMQLQMCDQDEPGDNNHNNKNANLVSPEMKPQQHPAVTPLSINEASSVDKSDHPFVALPLATATLGAFLVQYGDASKKEQTFLTAAAPASPLNISAQTEQKMISDMSNIDYTMIF